MTVFDVINKLQSDIDMLKAMLNEVPVQQVESIELKIHNILQRYQIKPNLKGYRYLKKALKMVYENNEMMYQMTKGIYGTIAITNNDTPSRVERAIRHAIELSWAKTLFTESRPTNAEFIAMLVEQLRLGNN